MVLELFGGKRLVILVALGLSLVQPKAREQPDQARLVAILKKSAEYCQRLEKAALDFVCLEEVTEPSRYDTSKSDVYLHDSEFSYRQVLQDHSPPANVYLYDYQFIRKGLEAREKRNLIAVNGKKKNIQDSSLHTVMFQYKNVLFGPAGLLSKSWQSYFSYKLVGEDFVNKEKVVVIEATPALPLAEPHPYGRVWVKEEDGSVLKIVWDQRSLANFQSIEEWAKAHDAIPQIIAFCEYGFEKNGLYFPSRNYAENASIKTNKKKFVYTKVDVRYKNYKFFTVETEIKY